MRPSSYGVERHGTGYRVVVFYGNKSFPVEGLPPLSEKGAHELAKFLAAKNRSFAP